MQTQKAIQARYDERKGSDFLGFEVNEYLSALEYEYVKDLLKKGETEESWGPPTLQTDEDVMGQMRDYMEFAFEKANNQRGISADRSICHYIAWTWLIDPEFSAKLEEEYKGNYHSYGKHLLVGICKHYGWETPEEEVEGWWLDLGREEDER